MSFNLRAVAVATALTITASTFNVTPASADMRHHAPRHHGGGGYGQAMMIGAGVGLGMMLLNAAAQAQQNAQIEREIQAQIDRSKVVKKKPVPKQDTPVVVKKDDKPRVEKASAEPTLRFAHPLYTTPELPTVTEVPNCGANCDLLWKSIQHYQDIIKEDTRKLDERKAEKTNRENAANVHRANAKKAKTGADRTYENEMARIADQAATDLGEGITRLTKLIEEEQAILKDRIAQYQDCVKRACPPQANAAPAAINPR